MRMRNDASETIQSTVSVVRESRRTTSDLRPIFEDNIRRDRNDEEDLTESSSSISDPTESQYKSKYPSLLQEIIWSKVNARAQKEEGPELGLSILSPSDSSEEDDSVTSTQTQTDTENEGSDSGTSISSSQESGSKLCSASSPCSATSTSDGDDIEPSSSVNPVSEEPELDAYCLHNSYMAEERKQELEVDEDQDCSSISPSSSPLRLSSSDYGFNVSSPAPDSPTADIPLPQALLVPPATITASPTTARLFDLADTLRPGLQPQMPHKFLVPSLLSEYYPPRSEFWPQSTEMKRRSGSLSTPSTSELKENDENDDDADLSVSAAEPRTMPVSMKRKRKENDGTGRDFSGSSSPSPAKKSRRYTVPLCP
ncbi:hypothetical protein BT96DRAFT_925286 [Gymnopus androsaceus JB14]|uniref:Uncharacterized protein n=1 Tax=Gymnopus androsaceus JB14 TaxID=1447944 RepID=A0A6A4H2D4_9AGAR|nr:hypothetical protein BT96DRAFT_925286 [Gymnopus androsaceus JB14]